jgi:1-acyl-sn-glycerol-3-phosphate acyltransferase
MLKKLPSLLLGCLTLSMIALNTLFWVLAFVPLIVLKFLPIPAVQNFSTLTLMRFADYWVAGNSQIMKMTQNTIWDIQNAEGLDLNHSYLLISNHRSWTDIFVLQHIFRGQIPFLKFFLKQELIWVPLLGVAWWALDFPFMKRYSREFLEKNPHLRGKDMQTTRHHCEKFKQYPVSVINFLEGTRFKPEKQVKQKSPYKHLLKPKAGGVALVLAAMGDTLDQVVDVSIVYPQNSHKKLFWALLSGKLPEIAVHVRTLPIPENVVGRDYLADQAYQEQIQNWVNLLWTEKDARLELLLSKSQPISSESLNPLLQ